MHYNSNINKIDEQLKKLFTNVEIDNSDYRVLNIHLSSPILENVSNNLELRIFVEQRDLNNPLPILTWGYYTNPNELGDSIRFRTPLESMTLTLEGIVVNKRLDSLYLEHLSNLDMVQINESSEVEIIPIGSFDEVIDVEDCLTIDKDKMISLFESRYSVKVDSIELSILGEKDFMETENTEDNDFQLVICLSPITDNLSFKTWVEISADVSKLPYIIDTNIDTDNRILTIFFESGNLVELK